MIVPNMLFRNRDIAFLIALVVVASIAVFMLSGIFGVRTSVDRKSEAVSSDLSVPPRREVSIGGTSFQAEIADTDSLRKAGLGGRDGLCERCGMLFVFDRPDRYRFWMKDMRFDLDFVWIAHGQVVDITENVPHSETGTFAPAFPADQVLEVAAGEVSRYDIRVGDPVVIR